MRKKQIIIFLPALMIAAVGYGAQFTVTNNSSIGTRGIYIEYNGTSPYQTFPQGCIKTNKNPLCCKFSGTTASFQLPGIDSPTANANFNIAVGYCGSSHSYSQAEFNLNSSSGDWVDASLVRGTSPAITITSPSGAKIDTASSCCGVYYKWQQDNNNCNVAPPKYSSCKCSPPQNNYCQNNYQQPQTSYTVTFS